MTISKFAYETQQYLQAETGTQFKRAHIYELLAAALGFNSYAAFCTESVFLQRTLAGKLMTAHVEHLGCRCLDLQYPPAVAIKVAKILPQLLSDRGVDSICVPDLISRLSSGTSLIDIESPIMLDGLSSLAERGSANAHYALALIYEPSDYDPSGSEYWYNESQKGRLLTAAEQEWADEYAVSHVRAKKYEHHLRSAGAMGHSESLLDLAKYFGDEAFFENSSTLPEDIDPVRVADIAAELGREEDEYQWRTEAAKRGDVEAMRDLIEGYDRSNPLKCWTWFYLAKMLGKDLAENQYVAVDENGELYDDDVGGPMYVGGHEGVELAPVSDDEQGVARQMADTFFQGITQRAR